MVLIHRFSFVFSIRLGSIIVGGASFLLGLGPIILFIIWINAPDESSHKYINDMIDKKETSSTMKETLLAVDKDSALYSQLGLAAGISYNIFCLLEMYGAYMCREMYLLPFLFSTFLLDVLCVGLHIVGMIYVKEATHDLGLVIAATVLGTFILLFMFYCLACVFSLWQVLRQPLLRELAEETLTIIPQSNETPRLVAHGAKMVRARRPPNLQDDIRYMRRAFPHRQFNVQPERGFGQVDLFGEGSRRTHYVTRPLPGISYTGSGSSGQYGALIAPVY